MADSIKKNLFSWQFFLIIVIALFIRVYHHHHILSSDEANNMLTVKALIEEHELRDYFFKHPPFFIILSSLVSYPFGDNFHLVQGISIVFSLLSFVPFFLVGEEVLGRRNSLISLFILALMPMNVIYSTWIKQEAMLLFFFLWSIYFYIRKRPLASGFFFGAASLTKEFAWFLIPIVLGWELLERGKVSASAKRFSLWLLTGASVSIWWYVFYGGMSFDAIWDAVVGGNLFEYSWHYPWYYYLGNLPNDLSLFVLPLLLVGLFRICKRETLFPLIWAASLIVPLSLFTVKAAWYVYLASPALSLIAGAGFLWLWDLRVTKWFRVFIIIAIVMFSVYSFNTSHFYSFGKLKGKKNTTVFQEKAYLDQGRKTLTGSKRIALLAYNPTLQYFLGITDKRAVYLGAQFSAMNREMLKEMLEKDEIGWLVLDKNSINFLDRNIEDLTFISGKPTEVGSVLIFNTGSQSFSLGDYDAGT